MAVNVLKVALKVSVFHSENTRYLNYVYKTWVKLKEHNICSPLQKKKTSTIKSSTGQLYRSILLT